MTGRRNEKIASTISRSDSSTYELPWDELNVRPHAYQVTVPHRGRITQWLQ
jgi:hypothetical protein